jgi:hypothetical protein
MKKLLIAVLFLTPLLALAQSGTTTYRANKTTGTIVAEVLRPGGAADSGALRSVQKLVVVFDGATTTGAAIASPNIVGTSFSACWILHQNNAGAVRTVTVNRLSTDGTVTVGIVPSNMSAQATGTTVIATWGLGSAQVNELVSPLFSVVSAAGGTTAARLIVACR